MSLTGPVVVCESDLDRLAALYPTKTTFRAIPRFPSSSRDVAFLIRLGWRPESCSGQRRIPLKNYLKKFKF